MPIWKMKPSFSILALVLAGCLHRSDSNDVAFSYQTQPVLFTPATISIPTTSFIAAGASTNKKERLNCGGVHMSGGGLLLETFDFPKNKWLLPMDPLSVLEPSYLGASSIEAGILGPSVRVEDYPAGRFGDFIRDGYLMTDKGESSDEGDMREVFSALAYAFDTTDECILLYRIDDTKESLEKIAHRPNFMPEIYFLFRGKTSLSVEIDKRQNVAIVRKADSIGIYTVRPSSIPLLETLCHILSHSAQAN
jgi:hypothetical protein